MNQKAEDLKLTHTHFITPHGLDNDQHYTTAYELAILTDYALKNTTFRNIVSTKNYTISLNGYPRTLSNTNELLGNLPGVYGVKTGFTFLAGRCLVSSCERNGLDIIVVVLGAVTKQIRTTDSRNIIEYIYQNFSYYDTSHFLQENFQHYQSYFNTHYTLEKTTDIPTLRILASKNTTFPLKKEDILNLSVKIYTLTHFSPDFQENDKIGSISIYVRDTCLYTSDIILGNQLTRNNWQYYFLNIFKNYFSYTHS